MANEQNLTQMGKPLSTERAQKLGSKGGKASAEARKQRKMIKDTLELLLAMPLDKNAPKDIEDIKNFAALKGKNITVQDALAIAMIKKAKNGDVSAMTYIRDTIGEKPRDNLNLEGSIPIVISGGDKLED